MEPLIKQHPELEPEAWKDKESEEPGEARAEAKRSD
jgi:hypothetical protein